MHHLEVSSGARRLASAGPYIPDLSGSTPLCSTSIIPDRGSDVNKLKPELQVTVLSALVEGASIRSVERMTGVHRDTITRLLLRVGERCETILDETMRDLSCRRIELDEIWAYVGKKQRHVLRTDDPNTVGDFWVWVALDSDTKLVPTYAVGKRDSATAKAFVGDLASRLKNRVQLSSDGLRLYADAIEASFGADVDYAQIVKSYEAEPIGPGRYSPPKVVDLSKSAWVGTPNLDTASTAFVERNNLTLRMHMRRFTRLTNAFSKKAENLAAAVALHFAWYNPMRRHSTLKTTPAVAAGVTDRPWSMYDLVGMTGW